MPGIGDSGPSGIAPVNLSNLVQPVAPAATPDAVTAMINAFRQGQISADDIIDRAGAVARSRDKAQIAINEAAASPEAQQARLMTAKATALKAKTEVDNAALEAMTQANKLKQEDAIARLGLNGTRYAALYTAIQKPIPTMEDPLNPGHEIPDRDKIKEEASQIGEYLNYKEALAKHESLWSLKPGKYIDASGREVTGDLWHNAATGETSITKPVDKVKSFDEWKAQRSGTAVATVTPTMVQPAQVPVVERLVTPVQIGVPGQSMTQEEAVRMQQQIEAKTGVNLGTAPVVTPTVAPTTATTPPVRITPANMEKQGAFISEVKEAPALKAGAAQDVQRELKESQELMNQIQGAKQIAVAGTVGPLVGSKTGQFWNRSLAALGIKDQTFENQRQLEILVNKKVLEQAKNMKGNLSDRDVRFLEASLVKLSDTPQNWQRFLDLWGRVTQNNLDILSGKAGPNSSGLNPQEAKQADALTPGAAASRVPMGPVVTLNSGRRVQRGADGNYYDVK